MAVSGPVAADADRQILAVFCRSWPPNVLVKSDANDWSSRMQMGGQVHATTHPGDIIPDMGPCESLIAAVSRLEAMRGPVAPSKSEGASNCEACVRQALLSETD